jgi:hypothetical protein
VGDDGPLSAAAKLVFGRVVELDIATLFERLVDMTLVSRSHSANDSRSVFGVHLFTSKVEALTVRRECDGDVHSCNSNELFIPADYQRGFDSRVTVRLNGKDYIHDGGLLEDTDDAIFVYTQDKIARSSNQPIANVYARMYMNALAEHKKLLRESVKSDDANMKAALLNVYIVMYDWGNDGKHSVTPTFDEVQEELQRLRKITMYNIAKDMKNLDTLTKELESLRKMPGSKDVTEWKKETRKKRNEDDLANIKFALNMFSEHFDSHVKTMGRQELENWLIPSLRCFPRLILEVDKKKK